MREDVGQRDATDEEAAREEVAKVERARGVVCREVVGAGAARAEPVRQRSEGEEDGCKRSRQNLVLVQGGPTVRTGQEREPVAPQGAREDDEEEREREDEREGDQGCRMGMSARARKCSSRGAHS